MAYILSLMNEKGGCAKTTSAVNIAAEITIAMNEIKSDHKRVLLIDTDPAGGSTIDIGPDEKPKKYLADMIIDYCQSGELSNIYDAIVETKFPGLDLIPSSQKLGRASEEISNQLISREKILSKVLDGLEKKYDWIIADTVGFKHNLLAVNVMALSLDNSKTYIAIPVEAEQKSIKSFYSTRNMIAAIQKEKINNVKHICTFLTKVDERRSYDKIILEKGEELFGPTYTPHPIHFSAASLRRSTEIGLPVSIANPNSRIAKDYEALCETIVYRILNDVGGDNDGK